MEKEKAQVISILRSVLQSAKDGIPLLHLQRDYRMLVGDLIPFKKLGYRSLENMLENMQDVAKLRRDRLNQVVVMGVADESTRHIESLVARQRSNKGKKFPVMPPKRRPTQSYRPNYTSFRPSFPSQRNEPHSYGTNSRRPRGSANYPNFVFPQQRPVTNYNGSMENSQVTYKSKLENFCKTRNFKLTYNVKSIGIQNDVKAIICLITVENSSYSSYPKSCATQVEAEEVASKLALDKLSELEQLKRGNMKELLIKNKQEEAQLIEKIILVVGEIPNGGLWNFKIETMFESMHNEVLPKGWTDIIATDQRFQIQPFDNRAIIYYNADKKTVPHPVIAELKKPQSDQWDVIVTFIYQADSLAVRLVEYSQEFEDMSDKMTAHYERTQSPPITTELDLSALYAIKTGNHWHRVQIDRETPDGVECTFVDIGDKETVQKNSLRLLANEFYSVPFQIIWCHLNDLDDYARYPETNNLLYEITYGKALVAQVTKKEVADKEVYFMTLYDTNAEDDININYVVKIKVIKEILSPVFPGEGGVAKIHMSHMSDEGIFYFNLFGPAYDHLRELMHEFNKDVHKFASNVVKVDQAADELYLAKYEDNLYYRAKVLRCKGEDVEVNFIDFGNTSKIKISDLLPGAITPPILQDFPPQLLKCVLSGVPPAGYALTSHTVNEFHRIMENSHHCLIKVLTAASETSPGCVELFKRLDSDSKELISINQTLILQPDEFFAPEADNQKMLNGSKVNGHPAVEQELSVKLDTSLNITQNNITTPDCVPDDPSLLDRPNLSPPQFPLIGEYILFKILIAASPSKFVAQIYTEIEKLDNLMQEMQEFYNLDENIIEMAPCLIQKNHFFAAKDSDGDVWYRIAIKENLDEQSMKVFGYFVDYGNFKFFDFENIQPLYKPFCTLPIQAIDAELAGTDVLNVNWSFEDCLKFKDLVDGKLLFGIIRQKSFNNSNYPELGTEKLVVTLIDTSNEKDVYIHELMLGSA